MFEATCHGRAVVSGVVARVLGSTLVNRLELLNLSKQKRMLREAHVKYIVLRPIISHYSVQAPYADYLKTYKSVAKGTNFTVLKVY